MGCVDEDRLAKRKCDRVVGNRRIRGRVVLRNWCLREPRDEFLDVANALRSRRRISRADTIPEIQV